ncbi:alpha-hydroxy acid oxidase [Erythrobacter aureus]|uniref:alpha-hydroxy acid oxidase n=1 Tax=Erythrobacter aureus TaxID=2182384 RepID=UPI003A8F3FFE
MGALGKAHNIDDLRSLAKRRLPRAMFDYIDGGAEDEVTVRANRAGFASVSLVPRQLVDVSDVDLSISAFGAALSVPFMIAPTGMSAMFHPGAEPAVAAAAAQAGTLYSLSTMASTSIEDVAGCFSGPKAFQLYAFRDRDLTSEFIRRARAAKYNALILTVDVPVAGNRERDLRNGMTLPPALGLMGILDVLRHWRWALDYARAPRMTLANVAHRIDEANADISTLSGYITNQFSPAMTWADARSIAEEWGGPFAIKGILHPDDARAAVDSGASAVIVSNHGGRQLDGAISSVAALPAIAAAVGSQCEVFLDGGIRRGSDIVKALALGAKGCFIGRPYLYGLGAAGRPGVDKAMEIMTTETRRALALLGCPAIREIDETMVIKHHT